MDMYARITYVFYEFFEVTFNSNYDNVFFETHVNFIAQ